MNHLLSTAVLALCLPALAGATDCRRLREVSPDTELRACPALRVAETTVRTVDPGQALAEGRERLAEALGSRLGQRPLWLSGRPPEWRVGVVLAASEAAPATGVEVRTQPPATVAALGFRGRWSTVRHAERQQALRRDLQKAGIAIAGEPWLVRYPRRLLPDVLQRSEALVVVHDGARGGTAP